jgi:Domain of unknown function (DUF4375)
MRSSTTDQFVYCSRRVFVLFMMRERSVTDLATIESDNQFLDQLSRLDTKHNGIDFHERPHPLGMLGGLCVLYLDVASEGIWKFLDQSEGAGFQETLAWCELLGARRTAEYLTAVAALFPGDKVPKDQGARAQVVMDVLDATGGVDSPDAFAALDRTYKKDALAEIPRCLRAYVKEHHEELEQALARPRPQRQNDFLKEGEEALRSLEAAAERMQDEVDAVRLLAETRGVRAIDGSEDPRIAVFMDSLSKLTVADWLTICDRYLAEPKRTINRARSEVASISTDMITGRLLGEEKGKLVHQAALRIRDRAAPAMAALPLSVKHGGRDFELRKVALVVANCAWQALVYFDWLMVTSSGRHAVMTLLAPFVDFAPLPNALRSPASGSEAVPE